MLRRIFSKVQRSYYGVVLKLRKPQYNSKVFCIGYNKTGTTTIGKSLEMLGYRNSSFNKKVFREYYKTGQIDKVLDYTARFDSVDDLPWLRIDMIPILDKKFPHSKFIYLTRDEESWKKSLAKWWYNLTNKHHDVEKELLSFRAHRAFVFEYFKNRIGRDLIILDVKDSNGFRKLSEFLGKQVIQNSFPHFNETKAMKVQKNI